MCTYVVFYNSTNTNEDYNKLRNAQWHVILTVHMSLLSETCADSSEHCILVPYLSCSDPRMDFIAKSHNFVIVLPKYKAFTWVQYHVEQDLLQNK